MHELAAGIGVLRLRKMSLGTVSDISVSIFLTTLKCVMRHKLIPVVNGLKAHCACITHGTGFSLQQR